MMEHTTTKIFNRQVIIVSKDDSIIAICFDTQSGFSYYLNNSVENKHSTILILAKKQLDEYASRKRKAFDIKLKFDGTDFQKSVWNEVAKIPYDQITSYSEIASRISKPRAYRAVANAIGRNPISIVIPCHRIIRNNGDLGGYGGGIKIKKQLLSIEAI